MGMAYKTDRYMYVYIIIPFHNYCLPQSMYFELSFPNRTEDPPASLELLGVLGIDKLFDQLEIFPARKFTHFRK